MCHVHVDQTGSNSLREGECSILVVVHERLVVVSLLEVGVADAAVQTRVDLRLVRQLRLGQSIHFVQTTRRQNERVVVATIGKSCNGIQMREKLYS